MLILMSDSLECIHDDSDDIGSLDRSLRSQYAPLLDISRSDLSCPTDSRSIYETYFSLLMRDDSIDRISCRSWHIFHDRSHLSRYSVHEA
jgi:hypothetical protein